MNADELYDLVQKGFDRLENRLISIENRLRGVEKSIAESRGNRLGWALLKTFLWCFVGSPLW